MAKIDFLGRYCSGDREDVWKELAALREMVWSEPFLADARAVAAETMKRVRRNVDLLIPRLNVIGYRFASSPHTPPDFNVSNLIGAYEREYNTCPPLSLRSFYEVVGAVDFRGSHPDWQGLHDPLQVYGVDVTLERVKGWDGSLTKIYLCPCPLFKEGYSAVGPFYLVPGKVADCPVSFEGGPLPFTFVRYLRNFFRWGGFAGCVNSEQEFELDKKWVQRPPTHQEFLTENLIPF